MAEQVFLLESEQAEQIVRAMRRLTIHQRSRKTVLLRKYGLQAGQDSLLIELSELKAASQIELAQAMEVDEPSVGRSLHRLEKKDLIARRVHPADARRRIVELTPEGQKLIPKIRDVHRQLADEALGDVDAETRKTLVRLLNETADRLV